MSAVTEPTVRLREVSFDPFGARSDELSATAPTTDAQREVWSATLFGRDASLAFNEANLLRLRGELNVEALRSALKCVVDRHESLRATISEDGAILCVSGPVDFALPIVDLSSRRSLCADQRLKAICDEAVAEVPFDLARGPLFLARLVRLSELEHVLLLAAHHVVCDGWSTRVLLEELASLYNAARRGETLELPPAYRFTDYALREQAVIRPSPPRARPIERTGSTSSDRASPYSICRRPDRGLPSVRTPRAGSTSSCQGSSSTGSSWRDRVADAACS